VNLVKIDGERNQWKNIEKELLSPPFLHDKKLIIVENFLKKKGQKIEEALSFLKEEKIPDGTVVVFREDGVPDARLAIFKFLNKPKQAEKFDLLSPAKLNQWIFKEVETNGVEISQPAAELLSELVGPDLWQMSGEIGKLAAYCRGRGKKKEGKKGLIEIDATGTGVLLTSRRVLEALKAPFERKYDENGIEELGQDLYFSRKAKDAGFRIFSHLDYIAKHYKGKGSKIKAVYTGLPDCQKNELEGIINYGEKKD